MSRPVKKLTVKDVSARTGAAKSTVTKWCRTRKLPNAKKIITPLGEYWEIPETDLKDVEVKMGRPKKDR